MTTEHKIALLPGDGIGPEVLTEARKVLSFFSGRGDHIFSVEEAPFGANAYFDHGNPFPKQTVAVCDQADAILKAPVGLAYDEAVKIPVDMQPERGAVLPLRKRFNTYANLRPIHLPAPLARFSPLKSSIVANGIDIVLIRELLGGLYFGEKKIGKDENGIRYAEEILIYDEIQIRQVLTAACEIAATRNGVLHNIHKANILKSSVLWNEILEEVSSDFPDVTVVNMLVDAATTHMCLNPTQFSTMVMENMFGDILSDLGGGIIGSLGFMPSACVGPEKSYFEPSHGSAPDIAGKNLANPYSMIGSVAMMLQYSFDMNDEAESIWQAMQKVFDDGFTTPDLSSLSPDSEVVGTIEFGDKVIENLELDSN